MAEARGNRLRPDLRSYWTRPWTLGLIILLATIAAASNLDLFGDGSPEDGWVQFRLFCSSAFSPTLTSESPGAYDLVPGLIEAVSTTIFVAFAAMSLAISFGFILGCLASESFWMVDSVVWENSWLKFARRVLRPTLLIGIRAFMALMRSVHEIFWAILGVAIFGLSITCGILALAIPYAATFGRIYAELLDETDRDAAGALRDCGAGNFAMFVFGLLPRAASSMLSYTFYRFDCSLRSSAILGFIGFPTLGLNIHSAVRYNLYREAWTYLYVLFFILITTEMVSGVLRRRLAAWR